MVGALLAWTGGDFRRLWSKPALRRARQTEPPRALAGRLHGRARVWYTAAGWEGIMKLYGHPYSTCTRKVLLTLTETNTPYELVVVDLTKGEQKQPPHLSRQPFGVVPAIDDDGYKLFESRAIARYINQKVRGPLVPTDLQEYGRMEQWISVETSYFAGPAMTFIFEHTFKRPQSDEALRSAGKALDLAFEVMDARLAVAPYFAGTQFSLADISFMPYVGYLMGSPLQERIARNGRVEAWWKRVSERPSWKKIAGG
jgi:glutathione S-transferase